MMPPEDMLISLCINSCRKRFFRLKTLVDITETIEKYTDLNWPEFNRKAGLYGCRNIVYAAFFVTQMTVGCRLPENVMSNLAVNSARAAVIRFFIRRILRTMSLSTLYPFIGKTFLGRKINFSLILPYVVYNPYQIVRRFKEIIRSNRHGLGVALSV